MEDEEKDLLDSSVGQWETGGRHSLMMPTSPKVSFIFDWRKREIRPVIMEGEGGLEWDISHSTVGALRQ